MFQSLIYFLIPFALKIYLFIQHLHIFLMSISKLDIVALWKSATESLFNFFFEPWAFFINFKNWITIIYIFIFVKLSALILLLEIERNPNYPFKIILSFVRSNIHELNTASNSNSKVINLWKILTYTRCITPNGRI